MKFVDNEILTRCFNAIFFGIGGAVGSRLLMVLTNIVLSRILGEEYYGQYSFINNTVNLFVTFSGLGLTATLVRYIAANKQDKVLQGIYIKTLSIYCGIFSLLFSALLYIFSDIVSVYSCGNYTLSYYFQIVSIAIFFSSLANIEQGIMIGFEQFKISSLLQIIRCIIYFISSWILTINLGILGSIYAIVITYGCLLFLSLLVNYRYYNFNNIHLRFVISKATNESLIKFSLPAFISSIYVLPINWICNAILTNYSGFTQMAYFSIAQQWMTYITYIPSQLGQLRPIYTDLLVNKQFIKLRKIVNKTTLITTGIAFIAATSISIFSEKILFVYGSTYIESEYAFITMLFVAVLYTAQVQTGFIIQAAGRMWLGVLVNTIWGFSLIICFMILKKYMALGYAVSYFISYAIIVVLQYFIYQKIIYRNSGGTICKK